MAVGNKEVMKHKPIIDQDKFNACNSWANELAKAVVCSCDYNQLLDLFASTFLSIMYYDEKLGRELLDYYIAKMHNRPVKINSQEFLRTIDWTNITKQ